MVWENTYWLTDRAGQENIFRLLWTHVRLYCIQSEPGIFSSGPPAHLVNKLILYAPWDGNFQHPGRFQILAAFKYKVFEWFYQEFVGFFTRTSIYFLKKSNNNNSNWGIVWTVNRIGGKVMVMPLTRKSQNKWWALGPNSTWVEANF